MPTQWWWSYEGKPAEGWTINVARCVHIFEIRSTNLDCNRCSLVSVSWYKLSDQILLIMEKKSQRIYSAENSKVSSIIFWWVEYMVCFIVLSIHYSCSLINRFCCYKKVAVRFWRRGKETCHGGIWKKPATETYISA